MKLPPAESAPRPFLMRRPTHHGQQEAMKPRSLGDVIGDVVLAIA
jgi:hypothetical protein